MPIPRTYKTEAVVLRAYEAGEADRLLVLLTPARGKVRAVVRGARKPKSKLGGHLDLLTQSSLLLAQGQNLDIVTQSQTIESFLPLRSDLWRTSCAIYLLELVDQFTAEQVENYPVYRLLQTTLLRLCEAQSNELVLRYFELQLLSHLGYQPELYQCLNCRAPLAPGRNLFSVSGGGVICPNCAKKEQLVRSISVDAIKVMRFLLKNDLTSASSLQMSPDLTHELEQLIREYIRYLLEHEVKSVEFLDRLRGELLL